MPNVWHWVSVSVSIMCCWVAHWQPHWQQFDWTPIYEYSRIPLRVTSLPFFVILILTLPVNMETITETTHPTHIHTHCRYPTPPYTSTQHKTPKYTYAHTVTTHNPKYHFTHMHTPHNLHTTQSKYSHTHIHTPITERERTKEWIIIIYICLHHTASLWFFKSGFHCVALGVLLLIL